MAKKTVKKKPGRDPNKLTEREKLFCREYIATRFNATQAGKNAGYKGSTAVIGVTAHELLKKPKIKNLVNKLTMEYLQDPERLGREVLERLRLIALRKVTDIVDVDPDTKRSTIKPFDQMNGADVAINKIKIESVDMTTGGEVNEDSTLVSSKTEVWLEPPTKSLELLGKSLNVLNDNIKSKVEHEFPNGEFANTKKIDPSKLKTDELKTLKKMLKKMEKGEK